MSAQPDRHRRRRQDSRRPARCARAAHRAQPVVGICGHEEASGPALARALHARLDVEPVLRAPVPREIPRPDARDPDRTASASNPSRDCPVGRAVLPSPVTSRSWARRGCCRSSHTTRPGWMSTAASARYTLSIRGRAWSAAAWSFRTGIRSSRSRRFPPRGVRASRSAAAFARRPRAGYSTPIRPTSSARWARLWSRGPYIPGSRRCYPTPARDCR